MTSTRASDDLGVIRNRTFDEIAIGDSASIGGFATGRFTTPDEVATLVAVLASGRTGNVTGANYVIDGGLIKTT